MAEAFRGDISVKLDTFSFGVVKKDLILSTLSTTFVEIHFYLQIILELLTGLPPYDEERDGNDLVSNNIVFMKNNFSHGSKDHGSLKKIHKNIRFIEEQIELISIIIGNFRIVSI